MLFSQKRSETISDIMRPIETIVEKLRAFRERTLGEAQAETAEAEACVKRAAELREEAKQAEKLINKYE